MLHVKSVGMAEQKKKKPINDKLLTALIDFIVGFLLLLIDKSID